MHIQSLAIFTTVSKLGITQAVHNSRILTILEYSEPWHIQTLTHVAPIQSTLQDL